MGVAQTSLQSWVPIQNFKTRCRSEGMSKNHKAPLLALGPYPQPFLGLHSNNSFVEVVVVTFMCGFTSLVTVWQGFCTVNVKSTHENPVNRLCDLWQCLLWAKSVENMDLRHLKQYRGKKLAWHDIQLCHFEELGF